MWRIYCSAFFILQDGVWGSAAARYCWGGVLLEPQELPDTVDCWGWVLLRVAGKGGALYTRSSYVPFLGFPLRLPLRRRALVPFSSASPRVSPSPPSSPLPGSPRGSPLPPFPFPSSPEWPSLSFRPPFVYFLPARSFFSPRVTFPSGVPSTLRAIARAPLVSPLFAPRLRPRAAVPCDGRGRAPMPSVPSPHASSAPHGSPSMLQVSHTSHVTSHLPLTPSHTTATASLRPPQVLLQPY